MSTPAIWVDIVANQMAGTAKQASNDLSRLENDEKNFTYTNKDLPIEGFAHIEETFVAFIAASSMLYHTCDFNK